MHKILLKQTSQTATPGLYYQIWEVDGVEYGTTSEWGNIEFEDPDKILIQTPKVTARNIITLAIHGNGPTEDGEEFTWADEKLIETLKQGGYNES